MVGSIARWSVGASSHRIGNASPSVQRNHSDHLDLVSLPRRKGTAELRSVFATATMKGTPANPAIAQSRPRGFVRFIADDV
jgi:hypothetical protein